MKLGGLGEHNRPLKTPLNELFQESVSVEYQSAQNIDYIRASVVEGSKLSSSQRSQVELSETPT